MTCPRCDVPMNHHADKPDPSAGDALVELYTCPRCGDGAARPAPATSLNQ